MSKNLSTTRDLMLALRWVVAEGIYLQRSTGKHGWEVVPSKNGHSVIARADSRVQAWHLLAEINEVFYHYGP